MLNSAAATNSNESQMEFLPSVCEALEPSKPIASHFTGENRRHLHRKPPLSRTHPTRCKRVAASTHSNKLIKCWIRETKDLIIVIWLMSARGQINAMRTHFSLNAGIAQALIKCVRELHNFAGPSTRAHAHTHSTHSPVSPVDIFHRYLSVSLYTERVRAFLLHRDRARWCVRHTKLKIIFNPLRCVPFPSPAVALDYIACRRIHTQRRTSARTRRHPTHPGHLKSNWTKSYQIFELIQTNF